MQTTRLNYASLFAVLGTLLGVLATSSLAQDAPAERPTVEQVVAEVNQYCGACHAVPRPDILPKRHWPALIGTMAEIAQRRLGRANISRNQLRNITAFYYGGAPENLPLLPLVSDAPTGAFVMKAIGAQSALPYVTHVNKSPLQKTRDVELIVSDGALQRVSLLRKRKTWTETPLANADIPVHTQVVDFDADGDSDVLVAELGQFPPLDVKVGKVSLLRQVAPDKFTKELLQEGLGRVSDARALDLDGDGDLDLAIAVFGGGDAGELFWLENIAQGKDKGKGKPDYRKHELLKLSGTIGIEPADLNADGKTDLVVLIAQEHEMVVAFENRGGGKFEQFVIARAPHPMYGSTSLSVVDLDRDGDIDVLFTNGDAFDAQTDPKPYHGVQWLENRGAFEFAFHDIGRFYGAATAVAGDLDRDGDIDVVAGSWVNFWDEPHRHAVVWYENDGKQNFSAHGVATRPAGIVSLQLVDVNGDGAPDIVAGALRMDLLLAKLGSEYKAGRLFPPAPPGGLHPRVIVFENHLAR